jgi:hypothetical protein
MDMTAYSALADIRMGKFCQVRLRPPYYGGGRVSPLNAYTDAGTGVPARTSGAVSGAP